MNFKKISNLRRQGLTYWNSKVVISGLIIIVVALVWTSDLVHDAAAMDTNHACTEYTNSRITLKEEYQVQSMGVANVLDYGAVGDGKTIDTLALQQALNSGLTVYLPKGKVFVVDTLMVPTNSHIFGGGTLLFKKNTTAFSLLLLSNVSNVRIENIILDGNIANQASYSEHRHTIQILTGNNVQILSCTFKNLVGDGVYISHGANNIPSSNILVAYSSFFGTNTNRNGVSIIAGRDVDIADNYFFKMARNDMPGAINIESSVITDNIYNVRIHHNHIKGGEVAKLQQGIAIQNSVGAIVDGVLVANNIIDGAFRYGISAFDNGNKIRNLKIQGNIIKNLSTIHDGVGATGIISSQGVLNVDISGNTINTVVGTGIKTLGGTGSIVNNTTIATSMSGISITHPQNYLTANNNPN